MNFPSAPARIFLLSALAVFATSALVAAESPYLGEWSNGRGDTLLITATTIQFANDKPVGYRDLTRATDGKSFMLQITAAGEVNFFSEKYLSIECGDDEMRMIGYKSLADLQRDKNPGSDVTWYKEEDAAED
ncbi:MAG: hypothetical protein M3Z64_06720 [Verrucomicrobiota bacterium]|nr:hypothetical protein [Verrucomicrobiota bacterium]